jgi:hypothetical protein
MVQEIARITYKYESRATPTVSELHVLEQRAERPRFGR